MKSIRRGLWDGEVEKEAGRFACRVCGQSLRANPDADGEETVRSCPECGRAWKSRSR